MKTERLSNTSLQKRRTPLAWMTTRATPPGFFRWKTDKAEHASKRVELELVPGEPPTTLKIVWSGKQLTPMRPTRRFKRGEREPEQCEVLDGTLQELDSLLRDGGEV